MSSYRFKLRVALSLLAGLSLGACAGRLEGRQLRWHDTSAVKRKPNRQEGGRKAHSPSHRASDSRPRAEKTEQGVFESERMDVERYRVFVQTEQDERNQRYGPRKKKKPKKKAKPSATQAKPSAPKPSATKAKPKAPPTN